jgi:hypothetical protein
MSPESLEVGDVDIGWPKDAPQHRSEVPRRPVRLARRGAVGGDLGVASGEVDGRWRGDLLGRCRRGATRGNWETRLDSETSDRNGKTRASRSHAPARPTQRASRRGLPAPRTIIHTSARQDKVRTNRLRRAHEYTTIRGNEKGCLFAAAISAGPRAPPTATGPARCSLRGPKPAEADRSERYFGHGLTYVGETAKHGSRRRAEPVR